MVGLEACCLLNLAASGKDLEDDCMFVAVPSVQESQIFLAIDLTKEHPTLLLNHRVEDRPNQQRDPHPQSDVILYA